MRVVTSFLNLIKHLLLLVLRLARLIWILGEIGIIKIQRFFLPKLPIKEEVESHLPTPSNDPDDSKNPNGPDLKSK